MSAHTTREGDDARIRHVGAESIAGSQRRQGGIGYAERRRQQPGTRGVLGADERHELERLRAEVTRLRNSERTPHTTDTVERAGHRSGLRWAAVVVLLVLLGTLVTASVVARFAHSELLDTDRYVSTVAPLGVDPAVREAITDRVADAIVTRLDIEGITTEAFTELSQDRPRLERIVGLAPVLADEAQGFVHDTVFSLVDSDEFEGLWIQANRAAHTALVAVMTGDTRSSVVEVADSGTVSISLDEIVDKAQAKLSDRGFTFAERIPDTDRQFVLFHSDALAQWQRTIDALDKASDVLPWATLLAALASIWVAPRGSRLRALAAVG